MSSLKLNGKGASFSILPKVKPLTPLLWIQYAILPFSLRISFLLSLYPQLCPVFWLPPPQMHSSYQLSLKKNLPFLYLSTLLLTTLVLLPFTDHFGTVQGVFYFYV